MSWSVKNWSTWSNRLLRRPPQDLWLLIQTGVIVLITRVALILLPMRHVYRGFQKLNGRPSGRLSGRLSGSPNVSLNEKSIQKSIRKSHGKLNSPIYSTEALRRHIWAIQVVSRHLRATCLPQAIALKYCLRADPAARLIIGVGLGAGVGAGSAAEFRAHAWVQKHDEILIGDFPGFDYQPIWQWE